MQLIKRLESEETQNKFIQLYKAVNKCSDEDAANFFQVEKFSFIRMLQENEALQKCSELSQASCFMEVINNGLSFDKTARHIYLMPKNVKISPTEWETRITWQWQAEGLIYITSQSGSIRNCSIPIIVFEGDVIKVTESFISYEKSIPKKSNKILGGFCIITKSDNSKEYFWMDVSEMNRMSKYSAKQNSKTGANALYTSGEDGQPDEGFMRTKIILRALAKFPKKKITSNNFHDDETVEEIEVPTFELAETASIFEDVENEMPY
jgi:recombinational DNA repair protein RecT